MCMMQVAALMEEVRVLVLALGHLLADDFDGESPAIPDTLHHLCFFHHDQQQQPQQASSFASLLMEAVNTVMMLSKMLVQARPPPQQSAPCPLSPSHLYVLPPRCCCWCWWCCQRILEKPEDPLLSPVLNEAVLWCLARWGRSYLLPDPGLYKNQVGRQGGGTCLAPPGSSEGHLNMAFVR